MLSKIREKTQGIIATLILSFLAIPFILWGVSSYFDRAPSTAVAKVNGVEINQQTYRRALEGMRSVDPKRAEQPEVKEMVLRNLIDKTLLVEEAQERGYRVSDARLAEMIRSVPYFHRDGQFDPVVYESLLRRQGMRTGDFEVRMRQDNTTSQVQEGLTESAFVTDVDLAGLLKLMLQERKVSYAVIKPETFMAKVTVSPQDVEQYYQTNQDAFRTQEAVRIEYLTLSADNAAQGAQPTDDDLRQAYEAEAQRYVTPEKRRASHILVSVASDAKEDAVQAAQKRAAELAKQTRAAGANFAAIAKQRSDDKDSAAKGGDLGEVTRGVLPPELEATVNKLKVGEVSEPVRTQYGFHIVKLTAHTPEQRRAFESVKRELVEQVRKRKGEERFYELAERLRNLAYEHPEGLAPAAQELGLKVQTSDWFTRAGGAGIAAQARVAAAAFEPEVLRRERNSDVIEVNAQTVVALRVAEHKPAVVRPLAEVRGGIERTLKEQRAREQARAAAEEWVQKLSQGGSLSDVARSINAKVEAAKSVTREEPKGLDPRLVTAVFAAPRPKDRPVYGQVDLASQGYAVYAVEKVEDGDPRLADRAVRAKARRQLTQQHGTEYYTSYREGLRQEAKIKISPEQM